MLQQFLFIVQIIISIVLIILILMQAQGTGLSVTFGGQGGVYRSKRGIEKIIFYATILLSFLFFLTAVALIFLT